MLAASPISVSVGSWILRTACEAAASWRRPDGQPIRIAINLFASQYYNPSLVAEIEQLLAETGLAPESLELEITENIALGENTGAIEPLRKLRDLGVRVALDDFGTGYASLSFLTRMPLTGIKIDQNFVRGLPEDAKMVSIVRSLIAMAHNLGLNVVAEGVETVAQMEFLHSQNCDEAQGFLFAKPLSAGAFAALVEAPPRHSTATAATG
jgi:EAL domain-containing protein (putative c-di-GMP-specific phosphodiesterase class I)